MPLGLIDFIEFRFGGGGFDTFLKRQNRVVAGHDGHGFEFEALGQVHGADGNPARRFFHACRQFEWLVPGGAYRVAGADEFVVGTHEHPDFGRLDAVANRVCDPVGDAGAFGVDGFKSADVWVGAVKDRYRSLAALLVAVHVADKLRQEMVGGFADLV